MTIPVVQTATRMLGRTETNWLAAAVSGTGITISSILFDRRIPLPHLEGAVRDLLLQNPRLRSLLIQKGNKYSFETPKDVSVRVSVVDRSSETQPQYEEEDGEDDDGEKASSGEPWHLITEEEMNIPFPREYPFPVFETKVYLLPHDHSLLILRVHAAAADMSSTATMVNRIINSLYNYTKTASTENGIDIESLEEGLENTKLTSGDGAELFLPSIETGIPPGQGDKPFWAHGLDVVGYGLGSRRHAYLPFEDADGPRVSKLIRAALTAEATSLLLKECEKRKVSIYGVINAAGLKAVAAVKQVGSRGEHYGTTVLLQCRHRLQPNLSDSTIGFYHSAMLRTVHTSETVPFWELATRCTIEFDDAIKNRKHFTDMGDLNALMVQAMRFPNLTPSCSLRTTLLSMTFDPVYEDPGQAANVVGVKDFLSCSSTHGVGPCLAIFPFMRQGSLQFSFVYPSPLFLRSQTQTLVDTILFYLSED